MLLLSSWNNQHVAYEEVWISTRECGLAQMAMIGQTIRVWQRMEGRARLEL